MQLHKLFQPRRLANLLAPLLLGLLLAVLGCSEPKKTSNTPAPTKQLHADSNSPRVAKNPTPTLNSTPKPTPLRRRMNLQNTGHRRKLIQALIRNRDNRPGRRPLVALRNPGRTDHRNRVLMDNVRIGMISLSVLPRDAKVEVLLGDRKLGVYPARDGRISIRNLPLIRIDPKTRKPIFTSYKLRVFKGGHFERSFSIERKNWSRLPKYYFYTSKVILRPKTK